MNPATHKRLTIALGVSCVGLLIVSGFLFWNYGWLKIRVAFASEQTRIFEEMRSKALQSDVPGAAGCLEYVASYYAGGSKQEAGSRLDQIVERDRAAAERDIISYLRTKTGEDLGSSPEAWVQKYAEKGTSLPAR